MLLLVLATLPEAFAVTWTVDVNGGGDFTDIQSAIDQCIDGDRVEVAAGTYEGALDLGGLDIEIVGVSGSAATVIDGDGDAEYAVTFENGESSAAVLEGFTLTNTSRYGALYIANSGPTLRDLVIEEMNAGDSRAAVIVEDGTPTFSSCTFTNNAAPNQAGHIYIFGAFNVVIEDSVFTGGEASNRVDAGAIQAEGDCSYASSLELRRSDFAENDGVVSHVSVSCADLTTEDVMFEDALFSSTTSNGTAVRAEIDGYIFSDTNSTWQNNVGYGLYLSGDSASTATLVGSTFLSNGDDAVRLAGRSNNEWLTVSFDGVLVEGHATRDGGAVTIYDDAELTIVDSAFNDNEATETATNFDPGAIDANNGLLDCTRCSFDGNTGNYGGAVGARAANFYDCSFTNNIAYFEGGGLWLQQTGTLEDTVFDGNYAAEDGGGAYLGESYTNTNASFTLAGLSFTNNRSDTYGGGLYMHANDFEMHTLEASGNSAYIAGGIYVDGIAQITDLTLENNTADNAVGGGAVRLYDDSLLDGCLVSNNESIGGGGGGLSLRLHATGNTPGTPVMQGCLIEDNVAYGDAGGLGFDGYYGELTMSVIRGNVAGGDGGGVNAVGDGLTWGLQICDNAAGGLGGGAYWWGRTTRAAVNELQGSLFQGNTSPAAAQLYVYNQDAFDLINNTFVDGNPDSGEAAVEFEEMDSLTVENNIFAWNDGAYTLEADATYRADPVVWFNNFYQNAGDDGGGALDSAFVGSDDNIALDPDFMSYTGACGDDLRLNSTSGLIDEGDPTISDADGSRSDIGAYGGAYPYEADADGDGVWSRSDCDDDDASVYPGANEVWYDGVDADCDEASDYDADGDGYEHQGYGGDDCDDADPSVYPGAATEVWYDGVDSDCDGADDYDADGDGYAHEGYGGDDCDDADAEVWPGADDPEGDGVDSDCDGVDGVANSGGDSGEPDDTGGSDDTGAADDSGQADDTGEPNADDTGEPNADDSAATDDTGEPNTGDSGVGEDKGDGGCSSAPGPAGLDLALLALVALGRRRRALVRTRPC